MKDTEMKDIDKSRFEFVERTEIKDQKFETKPVGYYRDALRRFTKNKMSVVGAFIILALVLFAIIAPLTQQHDLGFSDNIYANKLPRSEFLSNFGIATGQQKQTMPYRTYQKRAAIGIAAEDFDGTNIVMSNSYESAYAAVKNDAKQIMSFHGVNTSVTVDVYYDVGFRYYPISVEKYNAIKAFEAETGLKIIYPYIDTTAPDYPKLYDDPNYWYKIDSDGFAVFDANGNYQDNYKRNKMTGEVEDFASAGVGTYRVRVLYYNYFRYNNNLNEPYFTFGTNDQGQDIMLRLANGIGNSLLLGLLVFASTFIIGTIIGAIQGYYGGVFDLITERVIEVISYLPSIVVTTLFVQHLVIPGKVSAFGAILYAFILLGWIGAAARMRIQFYRFKSQEYVLAARTLGARDGRIMFKHIFPNTLGLIITSSALAIPSIIYSEMSLSYLGIINLDSTTRASIGAMLTQGQSAIRDYPHILLFPVIIIGLLMLAFELFGKGLRAAFDPNLRGTGE